MEKKKTFNVVKKVSVTEENIVNVLANGLTYATYAFSYAGSEKDEDYEEAKDQLKAEGNEDPALEEVWARILWNGKAIIVESEDCRERSSYEGLEEYEKPQRLTLEKIATLDVNWKKLEEDGDEIDNCNVIQRACFGEVIYG